MDVKFYVDASGFSKADMPPELSALGHFLEQDVGSTLSSIDQTIKIAEDAATSKTISISTGNAFALEINGDDVTIECMFSDAPCFHGKVSFEVFMDVLHKWKAHHLSRQK